MHTPLFSVTTDLTPIAGQLAGTEMNMITSTVLTVESNFRVHNVKNVQIL